MRLPLTPRIRTKLPQLQVLAPSVPSRLFPSVRFTMPRKGTAYYRRPVAATTACLMLSALEPGIADRIMNVTTA